MKRSMCGWLVPGQSVQGQGQSPHMNCGAARGGPWWWLYHSLSSTVEAKHDRSWYGK